MRLALFCGGVGGARMAAGFAAVMEPGELQVIVNVGDDFRFCGLDICPDLDTVMYTLAGENDTQRGWGLRGETWTASRRTAELGGPAWFQLGDRDIATHLTRADLLSRGHSLSQVTAMLCQAHGIRHRIAPVSDAPVRTRIRTADATLDFQDYFVRLRAEPVAREILYEGAGSAPLSPDARACLSDPALQAVVLAPSNPWLSIAPMLAVAGMRNMLGNLRAPIIAISPIIAGKAVKGPAAKLLAELGCEVSAFGVAQYYQAQLNRGQTTIFVIDNQDAELAPRIAALGMRVHCTDILIPTLAEQRRLAVEVLALLKTDN